MTKVKAEYIYLVTIFTASILTWKHILTLQFVGEGFQYFAPWTYDLTIMKGMPHDLFARIAATVLVPLFRDQTFLYMSFVLFTMVVADLLFYLLMRVATGNRVISFISALLYSVSFAGKYDMFSNGGYQYFLQRAVLMPILIISLIFLHLYLERDKIYFYFLSLLLNLFAVTLGFFAVWFLPVFVFYPFVKIEKLRIRATISKLMISLSFIAVNYLMVSGDGIVEGKSMIEVFTDPKIYSGVLGQISAMSWTLTKINNHLVIAGIYTGALTYAFLTNKFYFRVMLAALLSLVGMLAFNVFLNNAAIFSYPYSSRYYYYPYFAVAVFWGVFLGALFTHKNRLFKTAVILIIIFSLFNNNYILQKTLASHSWNQVANKKALDYLKSISPGLKKIPSYVYLPTSLGPYGVHFAYSFYSHPEGQFFEERIHPLNYEELIENKVEPHNLYVLHLDPVRMVVVDKTDESRIKLTEFRKSRGLISD